MTKTSESQLRSAEQNHVSYPDAEVRAEVLNGIVRETVPTGGAPARPAPRDVVREVVSVARPRRVGSAIRVLFGIIWAIDAYFKRQPSFLDHMKSVVGAGAQGQPSFLAPWFNFAKGVVAANPAAWSHAAALIETLIAIALILGLARKVTYIGGAVYSILIWATAEGLGRTSGIATDIGAAIVYAIVFLALLSLDIRGRGTRPHSLDAAIEERAPWWRRIAEV